MEKLLSVNNLAPILKYSIYWFQAADFLRNLSSKTRELESLVQNFTLSDKKVYSVHPVINKFIDKEVHTWMKEVLDQIEPYSDKFQNFKFLEKYKYATRSIQDENSSYCVSCMMDQPWCVLFEGTDENNREIAMRYSY